LKIFVIKGYKYLPFHLSTLVKYKICTSVTKSVILAIFMIKYSCLKHFFIYLPAYFIALG